MSPAIANPIALTKSLRQEFTRAQLRFAQREIKSFLKFQVTSDELVNMIRYYLNIHDLNRP